jgi:hypothetical protein
VDNYKILYSDRAGTRRVTTVSYSQSAAATAAKQMGGTVVGPFKPGQAVEPEDVEQPRTGRIVQRRHTTVK